MGIEAGTGHQDEAAAVGRAERDRPRRAARDGRGDRVGIGRETDLVGEHVGGAERQDGERQPQVAEPVDRLVDGAVAARHHQHVVAVGVGFRGEALGVARAGGLTHARLAAPRAQPLQHRLETLPAP